MPKSDLNALQIAMINSDLVSEEEIVDMIDARKDQARKTRNAVARIMKEHKCSRKRAFEILSQERKKLDT